MSGRKSILCWLVALFLVVPGAALSQDANRNRNLIINGQSTQVPVVQVNGRSYVDLEALASAVNGSLSFSGSQIAFSVPIGSASSASVATSPRPVSSTAQAPNPGFSKG